MYIYILKIHVYINIYTALYAYMCFMFRYFKTDSSFKKFAERSHPTAIKTEKEKENKKEKAPVKTRF